MTSNELLAIKEIASKAKPFGEDEPSLVNVPWEDVPEETKERIGYNGEFFTVLWPVIGEIIDELLEFRKCTCNNE